MNDTATSHELLARAVALRNAGQDWEAYFVFLDLCERFAGSTDPSVRLDVAEAMLNVGVTIMRTGQPSMAVATFDKVVKEFPEADESVAAALSNKSRLLMAENNLDDAVEVCEEIVRRFGDRKDSWTMNCVAGALSNQGVMLIRQGHLDKAILALDEVCRRFGSSTDTTLLNHLAAALYNKGIALRDANMTAEAVSTFTEGVDRFADSASPESRRFAVMALYNRAITLSRTGDLEGSVNSAVEMVQRFRDSDDPVIRERLAKALYNRALIFRHKGMIRESIMAFGDVAGTFLHDKGQVVEAVVSAARRRAIFMAVIMEGPVGHRSSNIFTQTEFALMEKEAREAPAERAEVLRQDLADYRRLIDELVERDKAQHQQAAATLVRYLDEGQPFGLFLRNFEIEGSLQMGTVGPEPTRANFQVGHENLVEKQIAEPFQNRIPIFGINNNSPLMPGYEHHIPKLELPNENWQPILEELARAAAIVVVNIERLTPGVLFELDLLERLGKETRTVVVISEPDALMTALPQLLLNAPVPDPPAQIDSEPLARFPLKFYASDFNERAAKDWPLFDVLLELIEKTYLRETSEHKCWDGILF